MNRQDVTQWVRPRAGLCSLADKLATQPCKIAYLGASVTAQQAGYRPLLHQWFVEQSGQAHEAIHAAIGGVGSAAGVFLMDDLVVRRKPHLCLIEFATGDVSSCTPLPLVGPAIEGMVRKLHQINCAVCLIHLYRVDSANGMLAQADDVIAAYERVAERYQVPSLRIDHAIAQAIQDGQWSVDALFRDTVHTTPLGAQLVSDLIGVGLKQIGSEQIGPEQTGDMQSADEQVANSNGTLISPLHADHFERTEIVWAKPQMLRDPTAFVYGRFRFFYEYIALDEQNTISFQSEGVIVGMIVIVGPDSGVIEVKSGNQVNEYQLWDQWCHYERLNTVIFAQPVSPHTPIEIRLTGKPIDYSLSRKHIETPELIHKKLKMIGFMVRL